ncbi:MAG TPA: acyl carrier protein [Flavobacterium sp.]|jgi:acyl carrier protein
MKREEFVSGLHEELELEVPLNADTNLKELEEWDSMAAMIVIGYVSNNFGITLTADDLKSITTVDSLMQRIGDDKFN